MTLRAPIFTRIQPRDPAGAATNSQSSWQNPLQTVLRAKDTFFGPPGTGPDYDYPNPRGPVPSIVLRTWAQGVLLLKDVFFGAAGQPPANLDWPNPRAPLRSIALLTCINAALTTAPVPAPFSQADWPVPQAPQQGAISLRTHIDQTRIGSDAFFGVPGQPPANLDWPVPKGPQQGSISLRTHLDPLKLALFGQDQFFSGPGVGPDYDYPNPRGAIPAISLRTQLQSFQLVPVIYPAAITFDYPNPRGAVPASDLRTWLQGNNPNLEAAVLPATTVFDYPNPRGPVGTISLRTHLDPVKLELLGQDKFFSGPGVGPDYDYPNPRGFIPPIDLRTWLQGVSLSIQSLIVTYPSSITFDYPNPRGPLQQGSIELRTWLQGLNPNQEPPVPPPLNIPLPPYDWPNGLPIPPSIGLRTHIDPFKLELLSQDKFFGVKGQPPANLDWPVPKGPQQGAISLKTHLDPLKLLAGKDTFFGKSGQPPANLDWPVPKGPLQGSISLRTHISRFDIGLLGKSQFFGLAGNPNFDWPVPRGPQQGAIDLKTHADPLKVNLLGQDTFFSGAGVGPEYDYPNPRGPVSAIDLRTHLQGISLSLQLVAPIYPISITFAYPNPRSATPASDLTTWTQSPPLSLTAMPFPATANSDWPYPRGPVASIDLRTWLQGNSIGLLASPVIAPTTFTFDWPNPRGYVPAVDLRAPWIQYSGLLLPAPPTPPPPPLPPPPTTFQPPGSGFLLRSIGSLFATTNFASRAAGTSQYYGFDCTHDLNPGEVIVSVVWSCTDPTGTDANAASRLSGAPINTANMTEQLMTGGISGVTYVLTATITTNAYTNIFARWSNAPVV